MERMNKMNERVPMKGRIGYALGGAAQTTTVMVIAVMLTFTTLTYWALILRRLRS